jgi:GNAT superfamily N-acetyltransferase
MRPADVAIDVVGLPLPANWWRAFQESWVASQIEPWQTRLHVLLTAPATQHWNSSCFIARQVESGVVLSAAILDGPRRLTPTGFRSSWLAHVFTVPKARGQGLATRVVGRAVADASHAGIEEVVLATSKAHAPSSLYMKVGFHPVAQSDCLMRFEVPGRPHPGVKAPSVPGAMFGVRIDDLGACASIGARSHHALRGGTVCQQEGLDIEELLCGLLSRGPQLGTIRYLAIPDGVSVGVWDVPVSSAAPATLLAASTPDLRSLDAVVSSLSIPSNSLQEQFAYLAAHKSVA